MQLNMITIGPTMHVVKVISGGTSTPQFSHFHLARGVKEVWVTSCTVPLYIHFPIFLYLKITLFNKII